MSTAKPRIRVKAISSRAAHGLAPMQASYLRDTRSSIISTRPAILRDHRDDVRAVWQRTAGLAADIIQNSGRMRGAADQVVADTVGVELSLNFKPKLDRLGYDAQETVAFVREVKDWWKRLIWNPRECDMRGKFTLPQMVDMALRSDMVFGEAVGVMTFMTRAQRRQYGITTGTKLCMMPAASLVQDSNEFEGMFQGVIHDANGRPVAYRFEEKQDGFKVKRDHRAYDADGRQIVVHVYDPIDPTDVRGISRIAPAIRKHIQHEVLVDATIQTQILQTIVGMALTSAAPSAEAFEAIEALKETDGGLRDEFLAYYSGAMERARSGEISISSDPRISHLAPGEKLEFLSIGTPGPQFLPVSAELSRDMARAIGITYGGFTMDHTDATYSSVNMENASIWPTVTRRRERIAAPICQAFFENSLDEAVGEGRIPFKGGYPAFAANREDVCWALWQGPAKPTADDGKCAKAQTERLINGTSTLEAECGALGHDPEEVFESRQYWHKRYVDAGMPSPFVARNAGPQDAAEPDEPPKKKAAA
ncbi:phage portal protein [Mesorhizobium loti]|uniref:phage portal protein n=1 Tax=Rhizobium loti TaxID=381 RepID=UPI0006890BDB|nr:phage portal protein [Mesorhizobium loti]